MKIVIIGGTGLIGSKTAERLHAHGHQVIAAAPSTGVNTITGEGLAEALKDAAVVIDLANSPSFENNAVLTFFQTSGRNLVAAEKVAGVKCHVALSIVGTDRLPENGYLSAKVAQEQIIRGSGIPYTIVRSTQFFEFLGGIAQEGTVFVTDAALAAPVNDFIEISGPERLRLCDFAARYLKAIGDTRTVIGDPDARYFGSKLQDGSLVSDHNPRIGRIGFDQWFASQPRK
jgi:uncharacterized protein YbjT (DUF2867 family)